MLKLKTHCGFHELFLKYIIDDMCDLNVSNISYMGLRGYGCMGFGCTTVPTESRSWRGVLDATSIDKVCQCLAAGQRFSPQIKLIYDKTEILLTVELNTITLILKYVMIARPESGL